MSTEDWVLLPFAKEYVEVELTFTSYGLPFIDKANGWEMKLVSLSILGTLGLT